MVRLKKAETALEFVLDNFNKGELQCTDFLYLKENEKIGRYMPRFSLNEIDSLIKSGLENEIIEVYQMGKVITTEKEKYFYLIAKLWIVESIRNNIGEPSSGETVFPNLYFQEANDFIKINPEQGGFEYFREELNQVFDQYRNWWENKSNLKVDSLLKIDPLKGTKFEWK